MHRRLQFLLSNGYEGGAEEFTVFASFDDRIARMNAANSWCQTTAEILVFAGSRPDRANRWPRRVPLRKTATGSTPHSEADSEQFRAI